MGREPKVESKTTHAQQTKHVTLPVISINSLNHMSIFVTALLKQISFSGLLNSVYKKNTNGRKYPVRDP